MAFSLLTTVVALLESPVSAMGSRSCVRASSPLSTRLDNTALLSRRSLLSTAATAAAVIAATPALPSFAEATLVTRQQAYTRYVPRIERGRDFWAGGPRKYIASSDWAAIQREFEPLGKNKGGAIPKFFGPMRLYASSFSSKTISDKTLAMEEAVDELAEAATSLQIAADGTIKDTGLFSFLGGKKTMDEGSRSKLAQDAYKKGVLAFNKYIEIGNDGLGISFAPMDTID